MSLRGAHKSGSEPIPGYTLRKRLGAGGYGEVWLADAPGGLQKAVKLIYGTMDQAHATSELRSLQRIRQVYHPFLLSIERIEIVDSQVVIVTELAESSLLDRFEQCRRKGAPGIDRAQLLDFLRDAADALDFLAQKHALQHLDVKPGNLLIIADRIKVADFGLIKDLHDQNQSLVSGLTPTYSAPEIFDGRPDYRSDQYSLAIVYMEMLTGRLPFSGKSTGELARQHLASTPDMESLPPADRPVVGRALSKNPLDRYASCRQFIDQLLKTRGAVLPPQILKPLESSPDAVEDQATVVNERKTSTASAACHQLSLEPAIDVRGLAKTWNNSRAMFIGLGGIGGQAIRELRRQAMRDCDNRLDIDEHAWAVIDTDAGALNELSSERPEGHVPARQLFELRILRPSEYRHAPAELFAPLSRRWLYNIPRSLRTEGVRPLAILSLLDHYLLLRKRLLTELSALAQRHQQDADCQEPLRVYLLCSLHGGTGGGLLVEMAAMIRCIFSELGFSNYRLCGAASVATTTHNSNANLFSAAAMAALSELSYVMDREHEVEPLHYAEKPFSAASMKPFDWVTLVDGGLHGIKADIEQTIRELAKWVWCDSQTPLGACLNDARLGSAFADFSGGTCAPAAGPRGAAGNAGGGSECLTPGWLRLAATAPISVASNVTGERLARWCCEQTLQHAVSYMVGPKGLVTSCVQPVAGATHSGDFPLTPQASEDFTARLLSELGLPAQRTSAAVSSNAEGQPPTEELHWAQWLARISDDAETAAAARIRDRDTWKRAVGKMLKLRIYNWKQIEQIQLSTIEALVSFCENDPSRLAQRLKAATGDRRSAEQLAARLTAYLRSFSEQCLQGVQEFQHEGRKLARQVRGWCESIHAEKALNEIDWDVNLSGLPPKLQMLAMRVTAVLESTIQRLAAQQVGLEFPYRQASSQPRELASDEGSAFNLKYILALAGDLVNRLALELGISDEELNGARGNSETTFSFKQLASFFPAITQLGGKLHRLVVIPTEQEQVAASALRQEHLDAKTTLIGSRRSMESTLVCEASDVRLYQLVSNLWRPCQATLQLAERLRTRVDVDWQPADRLLEASARVPVFTSPAAPPAAGAPIAPVVTIAPIDSAPATHGPPSAPLAEDTVPLASS